MINQDLYNEIVSYSKIRLFQKKIRHVDEFDITHNVLCLEKFTNDNWKPLVDNLIYEEIKYANVFFNNEHQEKSAEEIRVCNRCENEYPISWYKCSSSICDKCYREKNKDRIKRNKDKFYSIHRERYLDLHREASKKYRSENPDKIKAYNKEYREKNKEYFKRKRREYYLKHKK